MYQGSREQRVAATSRSFAGGSFLSGEKFYGWRIVAASFTILFVAVGAGLYAPPVFLVPLQDHFGWNRAQIAGANAAAALITAVTSPLAGLWISRYGARRVMATGGAVMAAAFGLLALTQALWQLYAFNVLAAIGLTCVAWVPTQTLISNWFETKRGLAMGAALTGIGFGGMAMAPLVALLIGAFGWRVAFATLASIIALVVVGAVVLIVRDRPADLGLLPDGVAADAGAVGQTALRTPDTGVGPSGFELADSVRTRAFWLLSLCHLLWVFANLSIIAHLVAFLGDGGLTPAAAASTLGATVGISVGGRVMFGYLADRVPKRHVMSAALLLHTVATVALLGDISAPAVVLFVITFGLGIGGGAVVVPLLVGECFGLRAFSKILGVVMISAALGAATGPVLAGRIFDVTGSYGDAFRINVVVFFLAAVLIQFLRRPQLQAS